jgi:hypothetical protein
LMDIRKKREGTVKWAWEVMCSGENIDSYAPIPKRVENNKARLLLQRL